MKISFIKHQSEKAFACPKCVITEYPSDVDTNWVTNSDVYDLLQKKVQNVFNINM